MRALSIFTITAITIAALALPHPSDPALASGFSSLREVADRRLPDEKYV